MSEKLAIPFGAMPWLEAMAINLVLAVLILIVGWWLSNLAGSWVRKMAQRSPHIDVTIVPIAQSVVVWAIRIFVLIAVLARFGVQTASIIAVLGAAGLAIGLALQSTLQNIASGIMLLVLRPIRAGEFVSIVGKGDGTVYEVGLFMTKFVQVDGVNFCLPNNLIWGNPIINYSRNSTRRMDIGVGVRYGDDLDRALNVLQELLDNHAKVLKDPAPMVFVSDYKDSTVVLNLRAWTAVEDFWDVRFELNRLALQTLSEAGMNHPVPVRAVLKEEQAA
ncbi:MAG: mechanosensitive ion channel [Alcaligenaceae bacterium]|uniref:Small-conductance mechanosensitive channel n=1 Tax=Paenalcaligenes hermetiae TaxID=1157987 RepID=A0ABP9LZT9_9BURK|nr:mechanosensitive ion channel domain-containing protein [Paenalcaligenes sp.]NLJ63668.1 mechanosensitive ion channel [Alcaligenaceae bacterium]